MSETFSGFPPVYDAGSRALILGSFPSVMSRDAGFYYGNPRNRFWKTVCSFFGEGVPSSVDGKKDFLHRRGLALWDVVAECEIDGSSDASIRNYRIADIARVVSETRISVAMLNGSKAYDIFVRSFPDIGVEAVRLPSTSPANVLFDESAWFRELGRVFGPGPDGDKTS